MNRYIIILAALMLAGCARPTDQYEPSLTKSGDSITLKSFANYDATVTVVRLSDGTRCAVMQGLRGNALSCDWQPHGDPHVE